MRFLSKTTNNQNALPESIKFPNPSQCLMVGDSGAKMESTSIVATVRTRALSDENCDGVQGKTKERREDGGGRQWNGWMGNSL